MPNPSQRQPGTKGQGWVLGDCQCRIVVKLATERLLGDTEIESLGLVRQAFQEFREDIENGKQLTFIGSDPGYIFFQFLVCEVACIISSGKHSNRITPDRARKNLREITKYGSKELIKKAKPFFDEQKKPTEIANSQNKEDTEDKRSQQ